MKHPLRFFLGVLLCLVALWGASFVAEYGPHWAEFPNFLTGFLFFVAGVVAVATSFNGFES